MSKNKAAPKIQCEISSLKSKFKYLKEKRSASKESDEPQYNAGDQFGVCKVNKQQKMSDLLFGGLLFHWLEVINSLVNCLYITTRRTTGKIADCGALRGFIQQRGTIFLAFKLGRGRYRPKSEDQWSTE